MAAGDSPLRKRLAAGVRARDKVNGWKRVEVSSYEIFAKTSNSDNWLGERPQVFIGSYSVTDMKERIRYIDTDAWPIPPGELARYYLHEQFGSRPRILRRQIKPYMKRNAPAFCEPRVGLLAYIDLNHAYWEIIRHYPFTTDFLASKRRMIYPDHNLWPDAEDIDGDRPLRHALVGTLFTKNIRFYHYGHEKTHPVPGRWCQPSLYRICMDTLHAMARDVYQNFELWGWLTDACIITEKDSEDLLDFLSERWHFGAKREAAGPGVIYNPTSYRIGDYRRHLSKWTQDQIDQKGEQPIHALDDIAMVNVNWWRKERDRVYER